MAIVLEHPWLSWISAFVLSACLVRFACLSRSSWLHVLDQPNQRSAHKIPVPRNGGLAFVSVIAAASLGISSITAMVYWPLVGLLLVTIVSYLDDRMNLPFCPRVLTHGFAAVCLMMTLSSEPLGLAWHHLALLPWAIGLVLLFVAIVWLINLYNFMDGMDGLAGGMAVIGFTTYAIIAAQTGVPLFMWFNGVIAASVGAFLCFNWPPARLFMGDVGSVSLGYLAAWSSLWGIELGLWSVWLPLIVFAPFWIDATVTLCRRIYKRQKFWQAHKQHYYQRFLHSGMSVRKLLLLEYGLMLASAAWAWYAYTRTYSEQFYCLLWMLGLYIALLIIGSRTKVLQSRRLV